MMELDCRTQALVGQEGSLPIREDDEITRKLAMLIEGECEGLGPLKAARKFGFSKQRYFQLRQAFREHGAQALKSKRRGPKTNYRRTGETGDSAPLSRSGRFGRCDWAKASPGRSRNQHQERRTGDRPVWPSKKTLPMSPSRRE